MEVDVTNQRVVRLEACPSATGRVIVVVHTDPAEIHRSMSVALDVAAIDVTLHSDEPNGATQTVTDVVASKRSSCRITTRRGSPT
jgi:hypothetical protein